MQLSYVILATLLVAAAIAINLWGRRRLGRPKAAPSPVQIAAGREIARASERRRHGEPRLRGWVTRGLRRGDLTALSDVARGRGYDGPGRDQIGRLEDRGFLTENNRGLCRVTIKGRLALLLRSSLARS